MKLKDLIKADPKNRGRFQKEYEIRWRENQISEVNKSKRFGYDDQDISDGQISADLEDYLSDPEIAEFKDKSLKDHLNLSELHMENDENALLDQYKNSLRPSIKELQDKAQYYIYRVNQGKMEEGEANRKIKEMYKKAKRFRPAQNFT